MVDVTKIQKETADFYVYSVPEGYEVRVKATDEMFSFFGGVSVEMLNRAKGFCDSMQETIGVTP